MQEARGHEIMNYLISGLVEEQILISELTVYLSEILTQLELTAADAQSWLQTQAQLTRESTARSQQREYSPLHGEQGCRGNALTGGLCTQRASTVR